MCYTTSQRPQAVGSAHRGWEPGMEGAALLKEEQRSELCLTFPQQTCRELEEKIYINLNSTSYEIILQNSNRNKGFLSQKSMESSSSRPALPEWSKAFFRKKKMTLAHTLTLLKEMDITGDGNP